MFHKPQIVVAIGLGGIYEGYGLFLPHLHRTGQLPLEMLALVDGDIFEERNRIRQSFDKVGPKAEVRRRQLLHLYYPDEEAEPDVIIRAFPEYVTPDNVEQLIPDEAIVLLSPDNHPTRMLVSNHVKRLRDCLLIIGANDGIDATVGTDGTEGWIVVHYRKEGKDLTPPIEVYHPEVARGTERGPWEKSCGELIAQGATQVLQTNLLVGHWMLQMLIRYTMLPPEEAVQIAEVVVNSRTGSVVRPERRLGVVEEAEESDAHALCATTDADGRAQVREDS